MLVKVLKAFPYAHDGMHTLHLAAGDVVEVADDLVGALERDGFIGEADEDEIAAAGPGAQLVTEPVEIPADWRELQWFKLRSLAARLNDGAPPRDKLAAVALVEAELTRRGEA